MSFPAGLVVAASLGALLGGVIVRVMKLEVTGMLRLCVVCVTSAVLLGFAFLAKCPDTDLAGLDTSYFNET